MCLYHRAGSKKGQVVRLNQLSIEELREQVASFEHGKVVVMILLICNFHGWYVFSLSVAFPHPVSSETETE